MEFSAIESTPSQSAARSGLIEKETMPSDAMRAILRQVYLDLPATRRGATNEIESSARPIQPIMPRRKR